MRTSAWFEALWQTAIGVAIVLAVAFVMSAPPALGAEQSCPFGWKQVVASWYGYTGHPTALGRPYDGSQWLVAHKTLPFGTKVKLRYKGVTVVAPVLDRGPYHPGRTLDVSRAVAVKLGMKNAGVVTLCMEVL